MPLQLAFGLNTGAVTESLLFEGISYCLGSSPEADIVISHPQIASHHAIFNADLPDCKWHIAELGSSGIAFDWLDVHHSKISKPSVIHFGSVPCRITGLSLDEVARYDSQYFWRKQQLRHCERSLHSTFDTDVMLRVAGEYMCKAMDCERAAVLILSESNQIEKAIGYRPWMESRTFRQNMTLIKQCIKTKSFCSTGDVTCHDSYSDRHHIMPMTTRASLCVPIIIEEEVVGVVYGDNTKKRHYFTQTEVKLTQSLANILSLRFLFHAIEDCTKESLSKQCFGG